MEVKIYEGDQELFSSPVLLGILGVVLSAFRADLLWILTSLFYTVLIFGVSKIRESDKKHESLFKWTPIPFFLGSTGISAYISRFLFFSDLAFAAFAPILGYMIILNLAAHTSFETNTYFSAYFIFMFTLAAGAISGIVKFFSYRYIDMIYLASNHQLMTDFLVISSFGLLGTVSFILYLEKNQLKDQKGNVIKDLKAGLVVSVKSFRLHFLKLLNSFFWSREDRSHILTSRVLQIGILALVFYNLAIENFWGFPVALISFVLSIYTPLYSRFSVVKASPSFQFWVSAALFLYAAGESLRFQARFGWWNDFTHLIAGLVVGTLVIVYLFYLNEIFDNIHIPPRIIPIFVLIFILSISVLWESFEFMLDSLFGTSLQAGLQDTIFDIIGNTIGAFFALLIASVLTPFEVFSGFGKKDKRSRRKSDIISYPIRISFLSFAIFCGFIALFLSILRLDVIWTTVSSVFMLLIFGISKIVRRENIKWNTLGWAFIPLFLGSMGVSRIGPSYRIFGDIALAAIIPFLSFMIILNLIYYTRLKTNFHFTLLLMFVFSLSIEALMSIAKFIIDLYFGTDYLVGIDQLMMEFTIVTLSTLAGIGLLIRFQFVAKGITSEILKPVRSRNQFISKKTKEEFTYLLNSFFGKRLYHDFPWITKALPFFIVLLIIYAVYTSNLRALALSLPALGFSIIPYISKQGIEKSIPNSFQFWFSLILFFFLIGEILRVYPRYEWWTLVIHLVVGMLIALIVFLALLYIDKNSDTLDIPLWMMPILTLTCLLSVIFLEKLSAYFIDSLIGTSFLGSMGFTVLDILAALIGGGFALQIIKLEERI